MTHNRECPKCGTIGNWNWARKKELLTMPNGEQVKAKVIVEGELSVKCPKCGNTYEPQAHKKLDEKFRQLARNMEGAINK